jgi:hypothetical protein
MRTVVLSSLLCLVVSACSAPSAPPENRDDRRPQLTEASIGDLHFKDEQLEAIAKVLVEKAKRRNIDTSVGTNRVERLVSLESGLDAPPSALHRVNYLVIRLTQTDRSEWARIRQRAERDFCGRDDEQSLRVCDLLQRWHQHRTESVRSFLSSNYTAPWIPEMEWERRFHDFVAARPLDAGTWGWLLLRERRDTVRQQYDRADAESAYRFYLEFTGFGTGRDSRNAFSVPGVAMASD